MSKPVAVIGIDPRELRWLRMLLGLLRHPDPSVAELARQALLYLTEAAKERGVPAEDGFNAEARRSGGKQEQESRPESAEEAEVVRADELDSPLRRGDAEKKEAKSRPESAEDAEIARAARGPNRKWI